MKRTKLGLSTLGVGLFVLYILLERFTATPTFVLGIIIGIALAAIVLALLPAPAWLRLRAFKNRLFRKD